MKLGKKIGLGFGAVTLITIVLGIASYVMFGRVSFEVTNLSEHSLPKVQHSTDVEKAALNIMVDQKNYHIDPKPEYADQGRKDLASLTASLDEVDKVANKFKDSALAAKAQDIRKGAVDWSRLFEEYVSGIDATVAAQTIRLQKGADVGAEVDAYSATKLAEITKARAVFTALDAFDDFAYEANETGKDYALNWKAEDLETVRKDIPKIAAGYDVVEKLGLVANEEKRIADGRQALQVYSQAFEKVVQAKQANTAAEASPELVAAETAMRPAGKAMVDVLESFKAAKTEEVDKITQVSDIVSSLANNLLMLRYKNRSHDVSHDEKSWTEFLGVADDIDKLFGTLHQAPITAEDQQHIDGAQKGVADYVALTRTFKDKDDNVSGKILPAIREIAASTTSAAEDVENDAWKASAESRDSVAAIVSTSRLVVIVSLLISVVVSIAIGIYITFSITKPAHKGVAFATRMAEGDLTQRLENNGKDELGDLTRAMDGMGTNLRGMFLQIRKHGTSLSDASQELSAVSAQVSSNSEETSAQSGVVAAAAEQVSKNINTVATAAEEMSASVREIAQQTTNASKVAGEAVILAERTNTTIGKLGESSAEVGNVIKVITSIAAQTNLLALNATIEAARAGESGKGFAVVANEVKELARQTALASNDIAQKIGTIQSDSVEAVKAIREIGGIIKQIDEIQTSIAGAVEEQAVTTSEISRNVNEAALGSADIAKNIASVSEVAGSSTQAAASTAAAAGELARLASDLNEVVSQFKLDASETASVGSVGRAAEAVIKKVSAPVSHANGDYEAAPLEPTFARWNDSGETEIRKNGHARV